MELAELEAAHALAQTIVPMSTEQASALLSTYESQTAQLQETLAAK